MIKRKIIYFLVIFHILPPGNKASSPRFLSKLVNQTVEKKYRPMDAHLRCKYKCIAANELAPRIQARNQARFIDLGTNDTVDSNEMEAPSGKLSLFNLLSDGEDGEDGDNDEDGENEKMKREEGEEGDEEEEEEDEDEEDDGDEDDGGDDDGIGFNFFSPEEEEVASDTLQGGKGESLLKHYRRHRRRMHNLIFALLLAYKLKFFTVIPLLFGSLVLLIGATGIAGFFFALFAAALGIHVKGHQH